MLDKRKIISGFPRYSITKTGKVWSKNYTTPHGHHRKERWVQLNKTNKGYFYVSLRQNGETHNKFVHRLVLETYVAACPEGMECRHLDSNPSNNNLNNLCWGTKKENNQDAVKRGTHTGFNSKLKKADVKMIVYMYRTKLFTQKEIADVYHIRQTQVSRIVNKETWKHLWSAA